MLGDCDHYVSPYMRGVAQAMKLLGHEHKEVSIRLSARVIEQRVRAFRPDVIWTHMLLWPPPGSPPVSALVEIMTAAARRGARILIHDGDARPAARYPHDVSQWCHLALVNHDCDRSAWGVQTLKWPYFAPVQTAIASAVPALKCDLWFAGRTGGHLYAARTALLEAIRGRGVAVRSPTVDGQNTLDYTHKIAASADAVLGFGRPEIPGWVDTRVWQYPGAGGVLLHDDVQGFLEPWVHFVPYESGNAESVVEALGRLRALSEYQRRALRQRAFDHVQEHHSSVARVKQVLRHLEAA
jgi:hypothetical protein